LRVLSLTHGVVGVFVYRREVREIASRGFVGAVPYRSERAAALWFLGAALPGWLLGRLVDVAADAGDRDAVRLVGLLGLAAGFGGAVLMPRSSLWLQPVVCARLIRHAGIIAEQRIPRIESVG
jgi:hypothetical protein